jgi:hypothetical protein
VVLLAIIIPIKNDTTIVPANKSITEIQDALVKYGATGVLYEYEQGMGPPAAFAGCNAIFVRTWYGSGNPGVVHTIANRSRWTRSSDTNAFSFSKVLVAIDWGSALLPPLGLDTACIFSPPR